MDTAFLGAHPSVIDIGSNTVRLVVFQGMPPVHVRRVDQKATCGLGRQLGRTGRLAPKARKNARDAIDDFLMRAARAGAATPALIATAALREAEDGPEFAAALERRFGLKVRVLSGAEEARLAALGVASGMPHARGVVADLGGGSLELVKLSHGRTGRSASLPLGHLRLYHRHHGDFAAVARAIERALDRVDWLPSMRSGTLYVAGGSWRKFGKRHIAAAANAASLDGYALVRGDAESFAQHLIDEFGHQGETRESRVTLAIASMVLQGLLARGKPSVVVFSTRGLADGWLVDSLARAGVPFASLALAGTRR